MMLTWPDWNKLYAKGQCLYYGVPFSDEQWAELDTAKTKAEKDSLIRKWREEYLKDRDIVTGELKVPADTEVKAKADTGESTAEEATEEVEESIEDVKPTKKKGK